MSAGADRLLLALVLGPALVACASAPVPYEARPGRYDRLGVVLPEEVLEVQRLRDVGRLETASAWVARLCEREPANLPLGLLRQDVELERSGAARLAEMRAAARTRAERERDLPALLLAARVEDDADRAGELLARAVEVAPDSAWTHYALAHREADAGRWVTASRRLERALRIDPGHLSARRLETQLLGRGGDRDEALERLELWIVEASQSPFFRRVDLDAARLDMAHLLVLEGEPGKAARALEELAPTTRAGARAQALAAAVRQAQGDVEGALEAARAAQADPDDAALALVQQAILEEEWLGDPASALRTWRQVLVAATRRSDLGGLLLGLRARAAIERLEALGVPGAEGT